MRTSLLVVPLLGLLSGCGTDTSTAPTTTWSIQPAPTGSGNGQTGAVGRALDKPVRVLVSYVLSGKVVPARGATVRWTPQADSLGGAGSASPVSATTDAAGIASATWTLGRIAGQQMLSASINGSSQTGDTIVTFTAVATPGPAAQLRFPANPSNAFTTQTIFPAVQVAVFDTYGNQVTAPIPVTVALGAHAGGGTLSGTTRITALAGVAAFPDLRVDQAGPGYTLVASAYGAPSAPSAPFDIVAPPSGLIAFTATRDGNLEIYATNADGSNEVNLSQSSGGLDDGAVWSPDGSRIAFWSNRDRGPQIYVMNGDGSGIARLTTDTASDYSPAWSPDGSKIAFTSYRDGNAEVYVMNADGSGQVDLSNDSASDGPPAWSPDGSRIAFTSYRDGNAEIYVMAADGSNPVNLSGNPAEDAGPVWSPDGSRIAFTSTRDGHAQVYVMNADGSAPSRVTSSTYRDAAPVWSPDGMMIAFVRDTVTVRRVCYRTGRGGSCRNVSVLAPRDLYTVHPDGSAIVNLTNNPTAGLLSGGAAWSPDGSRIAFSSSRNGDLELYVAYPDGSGAVNITRAPGGDWSPVWKPR